MTLPVFDYQEVLDNRDTLFYGKGLTEERTKHLYDRFGGSIRHWAQKTEGIAWKELKSKIDKVASNGSNISQRSLDHKGSIVHVAVDFDKDKPIYPAEGYNRFEARCFILGSEEITREFSLSLAGLGRDELKAFMNGIKGERAAEAVYGILFEAYAHDVLRRQNVELNVRVVRRDGKNKNSYATITIKLEKDRIVFPFEGQEAKGINEMVGNETLSPDTYFWPSSSTFPTYDSALVVAGSLLGLSGHNKVGLLLQMTVSGATSILRRPNHTVKHYMRMQMQKALEQAMPPGCKPDLSVTTFCVPTACFHPFLFQPEQQKNASGPVAENNQAEFQFVIEIPEFLRLPVAEVKPDEIHGASGRIHQYMVRSERSKRMKLDALHGPLKEEQG